MISSAKNLITPQILICWIYSYQCRTCSYIQFLNWIEDTLWHTVASLSSYIADKKISSVIFKWMSWYEIKKKQKQRWLLWRSNQVTSFYYKTITSAGKQSAKSDHLQNTTSWKFLNTEKKTSNLFVATKQGYNVNPSPSIFCNKITIAKVSIFVHQ